MLKGSHWKEDNRNPYERSWELYHHCSMYRMTRILARIRESLTFKNDPIYCVDIFNVYYLDEGMVKSCDGFFKESDLDVAKFKAEILGAQVLRNINKGWE